VRHLQERDVLTTLQERFKYVSYHAEFEQRNLRDNHSLANPEFERTFMLNLSLISRKRGYSSESNCSAGIPLVHRRSTRYRPYHRSGSARWSLVAQVTEWTRLVLALLSVSAILLCFSLLAGAASASGDSFQEKYNLPQSPETLIKEILSRDEFKEDETRSFIERLLERLYKELVRLLVGILKRFPAGEIPQIDEKLGWMVVKMMLLGSAVVLAIYVLLRAFSLFGNRGIFSDTSFPESEMGRPRVAGSRDSWDRALMLAEKANYAEALINLFRFAVLKLDEQGVLLFHRGKTNGEILECINNDSLREILVEMVPSFNRVRYGKASCDRMEYEHFLGLCRRLSERI